jgi:hypothetical protein
METGTVSGLLATPLEAILIISLNVPAPVVVVPAVTVTLAGVVPDVELKPSQLLVWLAVQLRDAVPVFEI